MTSAASTTRPLASDRTAWLARAKWGVFCHYLAANAWQVRADPRCLSVTASAWNARVDAFDAEALAECVAATGAGYLFLTVGQGTGHYCSPNATYDRLTGVEPSKCSRRDLILDLADALRARGVRMMVYTNSDGPYFDGVAARALGYRPPWGKEIAEAVGVHLKPDDGEGDPRLAEFQRNWQAIHREWSLRWGDRVHGWWVDGCYHADQMYRHDEAPNFASFAAAMKAGNADAIVAFNPGVPNKVISHTEHEDYTAGEFPRHGLPQCEGPFIDGARAHTLGFLGTLWRRGARPRFPDELVAAYTRYVNHHGGAVTWDVPITEAGTIPEPFLKQLTAIGRSASRADSTGRL